MADNERIDTLISTLIAEGHRHDQASWFGNGGCSSAEEFHSCGSTACAGGWTLVLFATAREMHFARTYSYEATTARNLLGLTDKQALYVFYETNYAEISNPQEAAIRGLKYIKDHPDATREELRRNEEAGGS